MEKALTPLPRGHRVGLYREAVAANKKAYDFDVTRSGLCVNPYLPEHNVNLLIYAARCGGHARQRGRARACDPYACMRGESSEVHYSTVLARLQPRNLVHRTGAFLPPEPPPSVGPCPAACLRAAWRASCTPPRRTRAA